MDETEDEASDRMVFVIDGLTVVTKYELDIEGVIVYKAHINDCGSHFTGYGTTRSEAVIIALNKCAG